MNAQDRLHQFEYPDAAGYPDGSGFLDEGTSRRDAEAVDAAIDADVPSAEAESELQVHRDDARRVYAATIGGREVARIRYEAEEGRLVIVSTTVVPEFRGRGIADALIADALDDIRGLGMSLTVHCPVVARFFTSDRRFADLLDGQTAARR